MLMIFSTATHRCCFEQGKARLPSLIVKVHGWEWGRNNLGILVFYALNVWHFALKTHLEAGFTPFCLWLFSVAFLAACLSGIPWDLGKVLKMVWGEWDVMQKWTAFSNQWRWLNNLVSSSYQFLVANSSSCWVCESGSGPWLWEPDIWPPHFSAVSFACLHRILMWSIVLNLCNTLKFSGFWSLEFEVFHLGYEFQSPVLTACEVSLGKILSKS